MFQTGRGFENSLTPAILDLSRSAGAARITDQEIPGGLRAVYVAERLLAAGAVILTAPVLFVLAVVTGFLSGRGPFVRHVRVGWRGETLAMWKLRTMWGEKDPGSPDSDAGARFQWAETVTGVVPDIKNGQDDRVTGAFAAFCRRHSLDELPQLVHVARGEMSFVGPRPITRAELEKYYGDCTSEVLSVRPGLTGLWQVMGRNRLSYAQRRRLDLFLVRRAGAVFYLRVLLRSIPVALSGNGSC
jgi:lipopolysaccharide/colanic/teichoic acid biosynthesis glycosyltransferase